MIRAALLGLTALLSIGATAPQSSTPADAPVAWHTATAPFPVAGPIYYVGTEGIAVYLIRTRDGLILLDGGLEENVSLVAQSIRTLGFDPRDVKLMIATHAHYDHVAALAGLKRLTGARFLASTGDRQAYETGTPPSDTNYGVIRFPAVHVDGTVIDGRAVSLGGVTLTPVLTPGHTPGCTSWRMMVSDQGHRRDVLFLCSITVAGNRLVRNKGYPGIVADFRRTFAKLRPVHADIVLPGHAEQADIMGKARRRAAGERDAFIDASLLPRLVRESQLAFDAELAKQQAR